MNPPAVPHPGALVSTKRRAFIGEPAPAGYVAGVGRGATGFTTRSDIGPARDSSDVPDDRHMPPPPRKREEEEEEDLNDNNYDEFAGYGGSLFNKDPYDKDDEEADTIYESIERRMDERGKALRESKTKRELEKYRQERPKIQQQFSDLKPDLSKVSEQDWLNIPDVGDARNRKQRIQRQDLLTPMPDSILAKKAKIASGDQVYTIDPTVGFASPSAASSSLDMRRVGAARNTFMDIRLNQVSDSVSGQTVCDPKGYLTELESVSIPSNITDPGQIKHYRKLLEAIRKSNPTHAPAWVFSAKFEEGAGRLKTAKALIYEGCQQCPTNAFVWLEAARLYPRDEARSIMVDALQTLPDCVDLWIRAAELETTLQAKRAVYRNAIQRIPHSVLLWQKSVDLEEDAEEAKKLLRGAVECCPTSVDMWIALSKLEDYEGAKDVLRRARDKNPSDRQLWITGAKLQEANGYSHMVDKLIRRSITDLTHQGVDINRVEWIKDAVDAESSGFKQTCHAIIKNIIGVGIEEQDRLVAWMHDAETFIASGSYECARAVFEKIVDTSSEKPAELEVAWRTYAKFESQHDTSDDRAQLASVLERAVHKCPRSETLWLRFAELNWSTNVDLTRERLSCAFAANPNSERIWLAAAKLESENGFHDRARALLAKARRETPQSINIIVKSAQFEQEQAQLDEATALLNEGKRRFRECAQFYHMLGQIAEQRGQNDEARKHYKDGLVACKGSNDSTDSLWCSLAQLEAQHWSFNLARSTLSTARTKNPKSARIWLESVRLERRAGMPAEAERLLTRAIRDHRDCRDFGLLLDEQRSQQSNNHRRT